MEELTRETLGRMLLGTLVQNRKGEIEMVKSMSFTHVHKNQLLGPKYFGTINGRSTDEFFELPVTVPLLLALGWTIEKDKEPNIISAWPSGSQFFNPGDAESFEVRFVLKNKAFDGFEKGDVVAKNGGGDWVHADDFITLERFFIETYSHRMEIFFVSGEVKIPG